jgi:hypothetical protein
MRFDQAEAPNDSVADHGGKAMSEESDEQLLNRLIRATRDATELIDRQDQVIELLLQEVTAWRAWWFVNERNLRMETVLEAVRKTNEQGDQLGFSKRGIKGTEILPENDQEKAAVAFKVEAAD